MGFKYILRKLIKIEIKKFKDRGILSIVSLLLLYAYFFQMPLVALFAFEKLPNFTIYQYYSFGVPLVHLVVYIVLNLIFGFIYWLENPTIESWKISKEPWPWKTDSQFSEKLKKSIKSNLINHFFVILPASLIAGLRAEYLVKPEEFPSLLVNFYHVIICLLVEDFLFYWTHRAIHTPQLYKRFHKQHHEYTVSICLASEYIHPFEFLVGNLAPIAAGPLVIGKGNMHILSLYFYVIFRTLHTAEGHCGYLVPFSPFRFLPFGVSTKYHDDHHLKNIGNYCTHFVFLDSIFGSNQDLKNKNE